MAEIVGFSPVILLESVVKRMIEAVAGRGGIEAICQFLDQIDWVPGLAALRQSIKTNTVLFETSISKCNKDLLKRPLIIRQEEIFDFLGCTCRKCGYTATLWSMYELKGACPNCKGVLEPTYALALQELIKRKIGVTPETVMMHVAYDKLGEAYVSTYMALQLVLGEIAKLFGWENFRLTEPRLRNYMDEYFLGRMAGEQKIAREEKECLQFLVRGNLAGTPLEHAEKLLRLGIEVVKFGYIYEVLGASGAQQHYVKALAEYSRLYDQLNGSIRTALASQYGISRRAIRIKKSLGGYYPPLLLLDKQCWQGGELAGELLLEPVYKLPIFPKADYGALQVVYGKQGVGKTFLLSAMACYSMLAKRQIVFSPLNDKSNSFSLAFMPLFDYDKRTARLKHILEQVLGVEPQGVPSLTITVLQKGETVQDTVKHPPTIFDRILEVDNPIRFKVDFNMILDELKEVSEIYGYSKPVGFISVRNIDRYYQDKRVNIDVEIATNLLIEFDGWRKSHPEHNMRIAMDEISYLASTHPVIYAGDALRAGATISSFIKEFRRNRVSFDCATQRPMEILQEIRDSAGNVFFRDLPVSVSKDRSAIDWMLHSLQLRDEALKGVIKEINNRGLLPKGFWFWHHQPSYSIDVIRPSPPTFMPQDPRRSNREVIQFYEKRFGQKVLLESWSQVKRLKANAKLENASATNLRGVFQ